jgi:hypothetical protein
MLAQLVACLHKFQRSGRDRLLTPLRACNQDCQSTSGRVRAKTEGMRNAGIVLCLLLAGCAAKKQPVAATPPPPIRSQLPPSTAELIEHCVVVKQENANTVTCSCLPATTVIDSKTGHTRLVCKTMKEEK